MQTNKIGFDNELYLKEQSQKILERIHQSEGKLYLEFGGKLVDDLHAARVLPGFDHSVKSKLLQKLKDKAEIIFCISAQDIEHKIRADFGITYGSDVLRLIDVLRTLDIYVSAVVITQYSGQQAAKIFKKKLEMCNERVYFHYMIEGYPNDIEKIVSDKGYGQNQYIPTTRPLVVVTAPGPGSGKLATCLSQLYHEFKRGNKAGYAKFETFPVWNLPLKHPVNIAYETATADLKDFNMIDNFHLDAYGESAVNYNRDCEVFPIVKTILERISGSECVYKSPTDMGVNMVKRAITDDDIVSYAAKQEIIRRYFKTLCDVKQGMVDNETLQRVELLMRSQNCKPTDRIVVEPALQKAQKSRRSSVALQLADGRIVTARTTNLMTACAGVLLNSVKVLSGIDDEIKLISPEAIAPIHKLKKDILLNKNSILGLEEVLIALSITAATNKEIAHVMSRLSELRGCEMHSTVILSGTDERMLRKLGINTTCEPEFVTNELYN